MKKLKEMKKNKKGFTLVEVIVVLVILAIMAAVLIPSLVGYIDKANENTIISETRNITTAVQTLASEAYAKDADVTLSYGTTPLTADEIEALCEIDVDGDGTLEVTFESNSAKIATLTWTTDGKTCTYPNYTVTDAAS
ncbi:MAG: prepilin-type N-terminal cleavage/methylation domain-containing protein [Ruminococcus sp.]|nr:prepilin-type N-terminal cleavage/methylation domain-containing protein [Ruminococcus sp.]